MSDDRELSSLYHSADKPQPPAALDDTIRSAAHKAVKPKRSHAPQWLGGIAASLITALLVTQLLPTMEQEASLTPESLKVPGPPAESAAPGRMRTKDALSPMMPMATEEKFEAERAPVKKQLTQEGAYTLDEADTAIPGELQAIIDLLDAGKTHEAGQRLKEFRERYPDTDLPETLTRRLEQLDIPH